MAELNFSFGGASNTGSWTDQSVFSDDISIPAGREMLDRNTPIIVTGISGVVAGRNATRSVRLSIGEARTNWFNVPSAANATPTAVNACNPWMAYGGGLYRFTIESPGAFWFGRGGDGTTVDAYNSTWPGTLGGKITYIQGPDRPTAHKVTASLTVAGRVDFQLPTGVDDGGSPMTGYRIFYSQSRSNIENGRYDGYFNTSGSLTQNLTGFIPGVPLFFRVAARNRVTDAADTTSHLSPISTVTPLGLPSAPRNLTAIKSTTQLGQINLRWTAPENTGGGITRYNIYANGILLGSTVDPSYTISGVVTSVRYVYTVRARNAFSDNNSTTGPSSNSVLSDGHGVPSAPLSVTALPYTLGPGSIAMQWNTPSVEAGGIVKYTVYSSDGIKVLDTTGTRVVISGLTPGVRYTYYVRAWNSIGVTTNTPGEASVYVSSLVNGNPPAPTGVRLEPSVDVPGRLTLSWRAPGGAITSYEIYDAKTNALVLRTTLTSVSFDNLPIMPISYYVRASNAYTTSIRALGSLPSPTATATPNTTSQQSVPYAPIYNLTNEYYSGTFTASVASSSAISYTRLAPDQDNTAVPQGSIFNNSNGSPSTGINGTYPITAVPSPNKLVYSRVAAVDTLNETTVTDGFASDLTNISLNGNATVLVVDNFNKKISYTRSAQSVPSFAVRECTAGTIINRTNTIFNEFRTPVIAVTPSTVSYRKVSGNRTETLASGTIIDLTNTEIFNGVYSVLGTPTYNSFSYIKDPDGIVGPRRNLVYNPKFKESRPNVVMRENMSANPTGLSAGVPYWTVNNQKLASVGISDHPAGFTRATRVTYTATSKIPGVQLHPKLDNGTYTVSAWVRHTAGHEDSQHGFGALNITSQPRTPIPALGEWNRLSWTVYLSKSGPVGYRVPTVISDGSFDITGVLIEKGSKLKEYFDGDSNVDAGLDSIWSGTSGRSSSSIVGTGVADVLDDSGVSNYQVVDPLTELPYWHADIVDSSNFRLGVIAEPSTDNAHTLIVRFRASRPGLKLTPVLYGKQGNPVTLTDDWSSYQITIDRSSTTADTTLVGFVPSGTMWTDDDWVDFSEIAVIPGIYKGGYFDGDTDEDAVSTYGWIRGKTPRFVSQRVFKSKSEDIFIPYGNAKRVSSQANLNVYYRSGWAG